jgi:hypothetical protein
MVKRKVNAQLRLPSEVDTAGGLSAPPPKKRARTAAGGAANEPAAGAQQQPQQQQFQAPARFPGVRELPKPLDMSNDDRRVIALSRQMRQKMAINPQVHVKSLQKLPGQMDLPSFSDLQCKRVLKVVFIVLMNFSSFKEERGQEGLQTS